MTVGYERDRPVFALHQPHGLAEVKRLPSSVPRSGKSTLVSLIPRLLEPWEGRVTLDGIDVRDVQT